MTNGWDRRDGSRRFQCNDTDTGEAFKARAFAGRVPWPGSASAPTVTIGTSDFSFEVWAKRKLGNSPGSDTFFYSGICGDDTNFGRPQAAINFQANQDRISARFDEDFNGLGIAAIFDVTPEVLGLWSHYAVNCDRDGNMEVFIDVESKGTVDISSQNSDLGSVEVHPLVADDSGNLYGDPSVDNFEDWDNYAIMPAIVGPFAVHNRLLTGAEIEDSYRYHKVNNFGSSVTLSLYDWTIEGETGWDDDVTHLRFGLRAGLSNAVSVPTGTSVLAIDRSGNNNHWTLPTAASYGATAATQATIAFCSDAFFRG